MCDDFNCKAIALHDNFFARSFSRRTSAGPFPDIIIFFSVFSLLKSMNFCILQFNKFKSKLSRFHRRYTLLQAADKKCAFYALWNSTANIKVCVCVFIQQNNKMTVVSMNEKKNIPLDSYLNRNHLCLRYQC